MTNTGVKPAPPAFELPRVTIAPIGLHQWESIEPCILWVITRLPRASTTENMRLGGWQALGRESLSLFVYMVRSGEGARLERDGEKR